MTRAHCELWVHLIWTTKEREPWLIKDKRWNIIEHIRKIGVFKDYHIDVVNGIEDHLHALVAFNSTQTISRMVNDLKGGSSRWINENNILELDFTFRWQRGYAAFSVSPSALRNVRNYILNQEVHHRKVGFKEEFENIKKKHS